MTPTRRFRWYGLPGEHQPEPGDVLVLQGSSPERYLLVHATQQVRGRTEDDLWLITTRDRIGLDGAIPHEVADRLDAGFRAIDYVIRPSRR